MTLEVSATSLDHNPPVWTDYIVRLATYPDLFKDAACRCGYNGLSSINTALSKPGGSIAGKGTPTLISTSKRLVTVREALLQSHNSVVSNPTPQKRMVIPSNVRVKDRHNHPWTDRFEETVHEFVDRRSSRPLRVRQVTKSISERDGASLKLCIEYSIHR